MDQRRITEVLEKDVNMLQSMKVMDYSLLLGIELLSHQLDQSFEDDDESVVKQEYVKINKWHSHVP